ncbi:MAG: hypothetical protein IAI49_01595 [Candidatus Eremiobacteraeota bacterium]|nr:hypothetical protein [Candidatus Eremiobacteraeota bacterium]
MESAQFALVSLALASALIAPAGGVRAQTAPTATPSASATPASSASGVPAPENATSSPSPPQPPPTSLLPASPSPSSSPSPALPPHPISLDRVRAGIVPGTTFAINVTGGSGTIRAGSSSPSVSVAYDPIARVLVLKGLAPGTASVSVFDDAGDTANVDVLVAPPAGVVPSDVTVELGGAVSPQFATTSIANAIAAAAQLRPGTKVDVRDATPSAIMRPGDAFEATARVHVDGAGRYVDANGTTAVRLRVETLARLDPQILYYSDDPEKLLAATNGVLYHNTLQPGKPARTYLYHVAVGSTHVLSLVLRATGRDARVQLIGNAAGPTNAFGYVGHVTTLRYLLAREAQQSNVVTVTVDTPYVLQLGSRELRPGELFAGAFDAGVLSGDAVQLDIVATAADENPLDVAAQPELPGDGHGRRGEFALTTVPTLRLAYAAGSPDPAPFAIGAPTIANLRAGGLALAGDYGVVRDVSLEISNPSATQQTVYLYEMPVGGSSTSTIWFAGDAAPTELPCVYQPNRYLIRPFALAPNETRTVTASYMTDGASSFPLDFGLTATPPSPEPGPYSPDACNPRTPPPATPSPAALPASTPAPAPAPTATPAT